MSDYISREAALTELQNPELFNVSPRFLQILRDLPAADVEPVRRGRWECVYDDSTGETDITCSHCKNTRTVNGCFVSTDGKSCYFEDDYCPNCGAKMRAGDDDNEFVPLDEDEDGEDYWDV